MYTHPIHLHSLPIKPRFSAVISGLIVGGFALASAWAFPPAALAQTSPRLTQQSTARQSLPGRRIGGGSRAPLCTRGNSKFVALTPESNLNLTAQERPTLVFYLPETDREVEFTLSDNQGREVYINTFKPTSQAGYVRIDLAQSSGAQLSGVKVLEKSGLKINQTYRWYLNIVCDANNRDKDERIEGVLRRVDPQATITQPVTASSRRPTSLGSVASSSSSSMASTSTKGQSPSSLPRQLSPLERAKLYQSLGLWADAAAILTNPAYFGEKSLDQARDQQWKALLEGLNLSQYLPLGLNNAIVRSLVPVAPSSIGLTP